MTATLEDNASVAALLTWLGDEQKDALLQQITANFEKSLHPRHDIDKRR